MKLFSRPQYYRIKRILEMIREGTATGRYPNAGHFMRALEVSRRTVIRDLDFLRDEENAPVEYDESRKGYYLADRTWSLPPAQLNRNEVFAFSIARKLLERFHGTALELDMRSVLNKIAESLEGTITVDLGALTEHFTVLGDDYVVQDPGMWSAVAEAVDRRAEIRVVYEKFNGEVKEQVLEPYHLVAYHGNWYVLAGEGREAQRPTLNTQRPTLLRSTSYAGQAPKSERGSENQIKTFAVSRIREIRRTGRFFEAPKGFRIKDHVEQAFGIVRGEEALDVRLLFSKNVAAYIRERMWHPSQKMIERRGGRLELRLKTAGWKELVRWILSWQPDVKVLAPAALRRRVLEKMRAGMAEEQRPGVRGQRSEVRSQTTDGRRQKTEDRRQTTEGGDPTRRLPSSLDPRPLTLLSPRPLTPLTLGFLNTSIC